MMNFEQDFNELNQYVTDLYKQNEMGEKDAGNLWVAFIDKFEAFSKKVLECEEVLKGIVDVIEKPHKEDEVNLGRFVGWAMIAKGILKK